MKKTCSVILSSILSTGVYAASTQAEAPKQKTLSFVVGTGLTFGGDTLIDAEFESGEDASLKAGGLFVLNAGLLYRPEMIPLEFLVTYGIHNDRTDAENGKMKFTRNALDLIGFYRINQKHRVGLGYTQHSNAKVSINISGFGNDSASFEDASGAILEWNYLPDQHIAVGIRLVSIDYDVENSSQSFSGNHIGVMASYAF